MPTVCHREGAIVLNNIRPKGFVNTLPLKDTHYEALEELYQASYRSIQLKELAVYHHIGKQLGLLHFLNYADTDLNQRTVEKLATRLDQIFHHLNDCREIEVAIAHGDFTPWNMFVTQQKLHAYDWELASPMMPILYDAFHYIFQSTTLIQQGNGNDIQQKIAVLEDSSFVKKLQSQYKFDFDWHWKFLSALYR